MTLLASGDSETHAQLVSVWPRALRLDRHQPEPVSLHVLEVEAAFRPEWNFDVIHFHIVPCNSRSHGDKTPPLSRLYTVVSICPA